MTTLNLLTIIAEEALASSIEKKIIELGAKGYTSYSVSGKGLEYTRDNQWEGENIKIETVVSEDACKKILAYLQQTYFDRYAIVAFFHPVNVVRSSHFL